MEDLTLIPSSSLIKKNKVCNDQSATSMAESKEQTSSSTTTTTTEEEIEEEEEEEENGPTVKSKIAGGWHGTKGTVKKNLGSLIPGETGRSLHHAGHIQKIEGHLERKTGRRPSLNGSKDIQSLEHHVGSEQH